MKIAYRIFRLLAVSALLLLLVVPAMLYVGLSLPAVQRRLATVAEVELKKLTSADISIGELVITPFNRVILRDVAVVESGDTVGSFGAIGAGVRLWSLVDSEPLTINYVELIRGRVRLRRDSIGGPLNIQPIIDAVSKRDSTQQKSALRLKINTILMRRCAVSYDVADRPQGTGRFDPHHIRVENLRADINVPLISDSCYVANIKRLGFTEQCGLNVVNLAVDATVTPRRMQSGRLLLEMPESKIEVDPITVKYEALDKIAEGIREEGIAVELKSGSYLCPADISGFLPQLKETHTPVVINELGVGYLQGWGHFGIELEAPGIFSLDMAGMGSYIDEADKRDIEVTYFKASVNPAGAAESVRPFSEQAASVVKALEALEQVDMTATARLEGNSARMQSKIATACGALSVEGDGRYADARDFSFESSIATADTLRVAKIGQLQGIDKVVATIELSGGKRNGQLFGDVRVQGDNVEYKDVDYQNFTIDARLADELLSVEAQIDNPQIAFNVSGAWGMARDYRKIELDATVERLNLSRLNPARPDADISLQVVADLEGASLSELIGDVRFRKLCYAPAAKEAYRLDSMSIALQPTAITLRSPQLDGNLRGAYDAVTLGPTLRHICSGIFPSLLPAEQPLSHRGSEAIDFGANDFRFDLTLRDTEQLARTFNLPVSALYPVKIEGEVSGAASHLGLSLNAPYLRQGGKLIEGTFFMADIAENSLASDFRTQMPTKEGLMDVSLTNTAFDDRLETRIGWKIERQKAYNGAVGINTRFGREKGSERLTVDADLLEGELTFNDSTWRVAPAQVSLGGDGNITIRDIDVSRANQYVKINGVIGADPLQSVSIDLKNFSLDYLFESLGIDKVQLGGDATGSFYGSRLLSTDPVLSTPGLYVHNISYNKTVIGDAVVYSHWDNETQGVTLDAEIKQPGGRKSSVSGAIYPMREGLDLTFRCDSVPVGFLQPYMEAFASDVSGHASGWARIFGTFKYVDLEGEVMADDLSLRVNFTNTVYTAARDSVHLSPGRIDLRNITIRDVQGHTALLNGEVTHEFFKQPRFEFSISEAHNLLAYDEPQGRNPRWYGQIYGNGGAHVKGGPGEVNIFVDMATAPHSSFTFILTEQEVADEYAFLTFRDRGSLNRGDADTIAVRDTSMDLVNEIRARMREQEEDTPSDYNITLQMQVTPQAQIDLVMDPVGGDRIRSYGTGHLRLDYGSVNSDLRMYGTYTLEHGDYNFTLQDVIIKDFTIKPGSTVIFNGDPYAAQLKIEAYYALNANLSDLDESFLQDKDLNRTSVPVHALMKVSGDIRQPEIAFDLEFPTLTSDVYRKVRSIVSTDDMMNRQIIYLLALNRFYTPEYMASTTKGSELVSVASSTVSSQLSNMLGQISDKWNISPTFRSDKGDFSDVEVDVALSSRLLNNRLLFNGNFGYRDNVMNDNQFIGDFDLEYILDGEGMWRLKAYNRYNDQNYYLRTARTTQGVGVVLKRDFNSLSSFIRRMLRRKKQ